jgi:curved DNA-binding protein CbpA
MTHHHHNHMHGASAVEDYYALLGLSNPVATQDEICKAYKQKALQLHPDKLAPTSTPEAKQNANEAFVRMKNAYDVLSDPIQRQTYDRQLRSQQRAASKSAHFESKTHPDSTRRARGNTSTPPNPFAGAYSGFAWSSSSFGGDGFSSKPQYHQNPFHRTHQQSSYASSSQYGNPFNKGGLRNKSDSDRADPGTSYYSNYYYNAQQRPFSPHTSNSTPKAGNSTYGGMPPPEQARRPKERYRTGRGGDYYYSKSSSTGSHAESSSPPRRDAKPEGPASTSYNRTPPKYSKPKGPTPATNPRPKWTTANSSSSPSNTQTPPSQKQQQSPPAVYGFKANGEPCKNCMRQRKYCWQHKDQDPAYLGSQSPPSSNHSSSPFQRCRQKDTAENCHCHPSNSNETKRVFGINKTNGQPCKICQRMQAYCKKHANQDPTCHDAASKGKHPHGGVPRCGRATPSSPKMPTTFGINKTNGQPCQRCIRQQGFCYQHSDQSPSYPHQPRQ